MTTKNMPPLRSPSLLILPRKEKLYLIRRRKIIIRRASKLASDKRNKIYKDSKLVLRKKEAEKPQGVATNNQMMTKLHKQSQILSTSSSCQQPNRQENGQ